MFSIKVPPVRSGRHRELLRRLRDVCFLAADAVAIRCIRLCRRVAGHASQKRPKLAIVAAHGLGDLVLLSGVFEYMIRRYPRTKWHITLVCSTAAREFAESFLPVDVIVDVDRIRMRRNPWARLKVISRLAYAGFNVAIQPNYNRALLIEDALIRATRASQRIGSQGAPEFISQRERRLGDRWYTRIVPTSNEAMHDLERNAEFVRSLGEAIACTPRPKLPRPSKPLSAVVGPYVLFAIGSSSPLKTWPTTQFVSVAREIVRRGKVHAVFCSGSSDWVDRTCFDECQSEGFYNLLGRTSLAELLALIGHARLVVSNDSGTVHLAAALSVPAVCIAGGGLIGRYLPYPQAGRALSDPIAITMPVPMDCFGCDWSCKFTLRAEDPAPCIAQVPMDQVLGVVIAQLSRGTHPEATDPRASSTVS